MPGVTVAEVVPDGAPVVSLAGRRKAAEVPQRVRLDAGQAGATRRDGDQVVHRLTGERLAALGDEQPGRRAVGLVRQLTRWCHAGDPAADERAPV